VTVSLAPTEPSPRPRGEAERLKAKGVVFVKEPSRMAYGGRRSGRLEHAPPLPGSGP
jgi:hypothetical protein